MAGKHSIKLNENGYVNGISWCHFQFYISHKAWATSLASCVVIYSCLSGCPEGDGAIILKIIQALVDA